MNAPADRDCVRSYRPGPWFGIVGERAVVALPPTEKSRVAALWELVDGGAGFDVTLDALISGGLRDLSGFVLISTGEGETKVVLRGPARAELEVDGETVHLEGSSATTWVERSLAGVGRMSIVLTDDEDVDLPSYVVDGGLFRVSRLEEAPAHEGADEEQEEADDEPGVPWTPEPEPEPVAVLPVRSPVPPSWTPPPPPGVPPPPRVLPPMPPTEAMAEVPVLEPEPVLEPVLELVPEAEPVPAEEPAEEFDPDHDGMTRTGSWQPPADAPPGIPGQVPAPDVTIAVARLVISSGESVDVDRAIVIGRAPEARRFSETEQPRLVRVPSPNLEISSTHLEVRPGSGADHGTAVVTDLGSTNGTVLVQPGLGPEDLAAGVAVQLFPGAVIDLGDGVTIQVTGP